MPLRWERDSTNTSRVLDRMTSKMPPVALSHRDGTQLAAFEKMIRYQRIVVFGARPGSAGEAEQAGERPGLAARWDAGHQTALLAGSRPSATLSALQRNRDGVRRGAPQCLFPHRQGRTAEEQPRGVVTSLGAASEKLEKRQKRRFGRLAGLPVWSGRRKRGSPLLDCFEAAPRGTREPVLGKHAEEGPRRKPSDEPPQAFLAEAIDQDICQRGARLPLRRA